MSGLAQLLRENWVVLLVVFGLAFLWLLLRTPASDLASVEAFDTQVSAGSLVVVEFFSNV